MDTDFSRGTRTAFARAVAAEARAAQAARRLSIREFAHGAGWSSHNYLAERLRDLKPLTLDDVVRICLFLEEEPIEFLAKAKANHQERLWVESSADRADASRIDADEVKAGADAFEEGISEFKGDETTESVEDDDTA